MYDEENVLKVSISSSQIEKVLSSPSEASVEELTAAKVILSLQKERVDQRLSVIDAQLDSIPFADLLSGLGNHLDIEVNGVGVASISYSMKDKVLYDQKAMNSDPSSSAPYREERHVLKPSLIEAAIRSGTFPSQFGGKIVSVEEKRFIIEAKEVPANGH